MERTHFRATSLSDLQAEVRERELLHEARARWRAPVRKRRPRTGLAGLSSLSALGRRLLG
jgi:hypothetical protein